MKETSSITHPFTYLPHSFLVSYHSIILIHLAQTHTYLNPSLQRWYLETALINGTSKAGKDFGRRH